MVYFYNPLVVFDDSTFSVIPIVLTHPVIGGNDSILCYAQQFFQQLYLVCAANGELVVDGLFKTLTLGSI